MSEEPSDPPEKAALDIPRRAAMFDANHSEPTISELKPVAGSVTRGLVKAASDVLDELSKDDVKALSRAFGNFDKVVALGRLLADAVGMHPLLEHARAHAAGLKAKREVGRIKAEIDQVKREAWREAGKLSADDPRRQELLAQRLRRPTRRRRCYRTPWMSENFSNPSPWARRLSLLPTRGAPRPRGTEVFNLLLHKPDVSNGTDEHVTWFVERRCDATRQ